MFAMESQLKSIVVAALLGCCIVGGAVGEVELGNVIKVLNNYDPVPYKDCRELRKAGYNISGPHVLYTKNTGPFLLHCEFTKDKAYNVIQQRENYGVNFMQTSKLYVKGFGRVDGNYWAGLDVIHQLTSGGNTRLNIELRDKGREVRTATYNRFEVSDSSHNYRLTIGGFSGSSGLRDELGASNGMPFTTYDEPDEGKCAVYMRAGWWYNSNCASALLNGYYYPPGKYTPTTDFYDGIFWNSFHGSDYSLKRVTMTLSD